MPQLLSEDVVDLSLNRSVSVRLYADNRPYALQTRKLQKGAVLVFNGTELVEEGLGIGAPICLYVDGARFSLNATVHVGEMKSGPTVTKNYIMNAVESKKFRGTRIRRGSFTARSLRILEKAYRRVRILHALAIMMLDISSILGLRNEYVQSKSKGEISVSYEQNEGGLQINVDFKHLATEGLRSIIIANEQGGNLFTQYRDSLGGELKGAQIEPWCPTSATWATLGSPALGVGFNLRRPEGWRIVRGREVIENRMSWSGLNLIRDGVPSSKALVYRFETMRGV